MIRQYSHHNSCQKCNKKQNNQFLILTNFIQNRLHFKLKEHFRIWFNIRKKMMCKMKQKSIENVAHNDLVFRLSGVIFGRDISPLRRYIFNSCIKFNSLRRKSNPCSFERKLIIAFRSAASIKLFVFRGMLSVSSRIDLLRFLLSI